MVAYVNSYERRTMTEQEMVAVAVAWHDVLGDYAYQDVMTAVREFFAESSDGRYFKPGDIAYRARRLADRRSEREWDARTWEIHHAHELARREREAIEAGNTPRGKSAVDAVAKQMTKEMQ